MGKRKNIPEHQLKKQKALQFFQKNRLADAERAYQALCRSTPTDPDVRHMLGLIYGRMGRFAEAEEQLEQAIRLNPDAPNTHGLLGSARVYLGKLTAAAESFSHAVRLTPNMAEAHLELGNVLFALERMQEAAIEYGEAIRLRPALAEAHLGLGRTHQTLSNLDQAVACYKAAIDRDPKLVDAHYFLGSALAILGHLQEAREHFRVAQRLRPGLTEAIAGEANICERERDYERAHQLIAPVLEQDIKHPAIGMVFAQICRKVGRCDEALDYLESVLQECRLATFDRLKIHFSLGKLYDRLGRYDDAFPHFRQGNQLQSQSLSHDSAGELLHVEGHIRTFTAETMHRLPRGRTSEQRLVFVVGMPRSGTTLTEQILASHPGVYGAGELSGIGHAVKLLPSLAHDADSYPASVHELTAEALDALAQIYLEQMSPAAADATRIIDKMPHNFQHLGLINLMFPKARIVHCIRNPMDTCLSNYFQNFSSHYTYATDLGNLGRHYRLYEKLMRHWKSVVDLPILDLHYEDLVARPEPETRRLLEFCELDWDDACLRFHQSKRAVTTASYDQVREPLYTRSVARWRRYEKHLGELQRALLQSV